MYITDKDYLDRDKVYWYKNIVQRPSDGSDRRYEDIDKSNVGSASINLTLSPKMWKQRRSLFRKINTTKISVFDCFLERYWKKIKITNNKPLVLRPGEVVFGRTNEKITIPSCCSGKIESTSSNCRLGLSVTYGDYCNPGYNGHYPLQLQNNKKNTIVLAPRTKIAQLVLIRLYDIVDCEYGDPSRESVHAKFDDGSPTNWWMSKINRRVAKNITELDGKNNSYSVVVEKIDELIDNQFKNEDKELYKNRIYRRLEKHIESNVQIEDNEQILKSFISKEKKLREYLSLWFVNLIPLASPLIGFGIFAGLNEINKACSVGIKLWMIIIVGILITIIGFYFASNIMKLIQIRKDSCLKL